MAKCLDDIEFALSVAHKSVCQKIQQTSPHIGPDYLTYYSALYQARIITALEL